MWHNAQKALCVLLLRAFARPPTLASNELRGGEGSQAKALWEVARKKTSPHWVTVIFGDASSLSGSGPLATLLETFEENGEKVVRLTAPWSTTRFSVELWSAWGKSLGPVSPADFRKLANEIARAKPPSNATVTVRSPENRQISIQFAREITAEEKEATLRILKTGLAAVTGNLRKPITLLDVVESCIEVIVEISSEDWDRIKGHPLFEEMELTVNEVGPQVMPGILRTMRRLLMARPVTLHPGAKDAALRAHTFFDAALRLEAWRRPWRRLWALVAPQVDRSPLVTVIALSARRCYAAPGLAARWRALRSDLWATVVLWPSFAALLVALSGGALRAVGIPVELSTGMAVAAVMAVCGAQPCSVVVSPLACGAGGVFIGWGFGLAHAVVLGHFANSILVSQAALLQNPFDAVAAGAIALTAPHWTSTFSLPTIVALLGMNAVGIGAAGWLMGQPERATADVANATTARDLLAGGIGSAAGVGIPLVLALQHVLQSTLPASSAFTLAFVLIGSPAFGGAVWYRTGGWQRGVAFAVGHALIGGALLHAVFALSADSSLTLTLLAGACAWYHSTWFTCAFLAGRAAGSPRAAVWAALLEGVGGYTGFLLVRLTS